MNYENDWATYMCLLENLQAFIVVDLGLADMAPISKFPDLVMIAIEARTSVEDNFPTDEEFNEFQSMSAILESALKENEHLLFAGTITHDGSHICYFYTDDGVAQSRFLNGLMKQHFPERKCQFQTNQDPVWEIYLELLYPDDIGLQSINNVRIIGYLEEQGDQLDQPREIEHLLSFSTEEGRSTFISHLKRAGLTEIEEISDSDQEMPYGIKLLQVNGLYIDQMNEATMELILASEDCGGVYEGWQTTLMK